jgi:CubicO group peptidase (beta-lactamase class C family)
MRLLGLCLGLAFVGQLRAAELDQRTLDATVTSALAKWNVPGAVVAVVHGDRAFCGGYGVKKVGSPGPPTADTLVPLASCTKAVTTTLLAMLADEAKLAWDDPVRKHLPTFHVADPRVDALISLRDLLSHRSGVRGHDLIWYHATWDQKEILGRIDKLPVDRPFRGSYEYSTLMFMAAGRAAEVRGGRPWAEQVRDRITGPLGMKGVLFTTADPAFAGADKMTGYRPGKGGKLIAMPVYETREPNPAGSIHLTARDLIPWLRFHLAHGVHSGKRLVSAEALAETRRPLNPLPMDANLRRLNPDTVQMSYAMGWVVYDYRGQLVVAHGGMIDGFRVQVALVPTAKLGVAIVNNLHDTKMNQAVTNDLADIALDLPRKDWNAILLDAVRKDSDEKAAQAAAVRAARRANVPPSVPLKEFAGNYAEPAYGEAEVRLEDGKLVWRWSSFAVQLDHWEADTFRFTSGLLEDRLLPFRVGKAGPDAFQFEGQVFERK